MPYAAVVATITAAIMAALTASTACLTAFGAHPCAAMSFPRLRISRLLSPT